MLYEYAVEPDCMGDWQTFRYLIEQFGVSHGRLVSQFPKDWFKSVWKSCESFKPEQRWKAEIELKRIKQQASIKSGRNFDGTVSWLKNACTQHELKPFKAIIVKHAPEPSEHFLVADDITHSNPRWAVKRDDSICRTLDALGGAVMPLLQMSDNIMFVDKMFYPSVDRWKNVLARFIQLAIQNRERLPTFEYHCGIEPDEFGKSEEQRKSDFQEVCDRSLSGIIPVGANFTVSRWDKHHRGDFFHARYILTEKGGIRVDWGLDSGKPGETTDISLLDDSIWETYWNNFQHEATIYKHIDSVLIKGTKCIV
ncbi:MAG: hypothetical protein JZU65_19635 [Chlorobium sp.]|nr:hypothetical protein [Chlorobium sp.]